jgi:hypothetical protein
MRRDDVGAECELRLERNLGVLGGFLRPDALLLPLTVPVDEQPRC